MKILVTGCAGFIGSHVTAQLLARGDEVVGLDNFDETLYPAALHGRNLAAIGKDPRFRFTSGDLLDETLVASLVAGSDVVLHLAALAGVRPSLAQPRRYHHVNVGGTTNILDACRAAGVRRVVFASSSSVYGTRSPSPFREDGPTSPQSPYAVTKRAGEIVCEGYAEVFGIGTIALRFFTVYGPRQRPEMAIHKFARLMLDGQSVPLFGDGSTARDYTFIDDIVAGVLAAIDHVQPSAYRVYNLGGSRTTTLAHLVELLEARLGRTAHIERLPPQQGDVPLTHADVSLAQSELGYEPHTPIELGLDRFCEWMKGEPRPSG